MVRMLAPAVYHCQMSACRCVRPFGWLLVSVMRRLLVFGGVCGPIGCRRLRVATILVGVVVVVSGGVVLVLLVSTPYVASCCRVAGTCGAVEHVHCGAGGDVPPPALLAVVLVDADTDSGERLPPARLPGGHVSSCPVRRRTIPACSCT